MKTSPILLSICGGIIATLLCLASCTALSSDPGARNAEAYVKELITKSPLYNIEDVSSTEAQPTDSIMSDIILSFEQNQLLDAQSEFLRGTKTSEELKESIEKISRYHDDICNSWEFTSVVSDSLHRIDLYSDLWRKVYLVTITFKSHRTKSIRVMMDNDGVTPYKTEAEASKSLRKYFDLIMEAENSLKYSY